MEKRLTTLEEKFGFLEHQVEQQFVKTEHRRLYDVTNTTEDAMDHIRQYAGAKVPEKFL